MTKRYPAVFENDDGWSNWLRLRPGYRMACCDCGLVHNLEFRAFRKSSEKAKPGYVAVGPEVRGVHIAMRAGRNNKATAQIRRAKFPRRKSS